MRRWPTCRQRPAARRRGGRRDGPRRGTRRTTPGPPSPQRLKTRNSPVSVITAIASSVASTSGATNRNVSTREPAHVDDAELERGHRAEDTGDDQVGVDRDVLVSLLARGRMLARGRGRAHGRRYTRVKIAIQTTSTKCQ